MTHLETDVHGSSRRRRDDQPRPRPARVAGRPDVRVGAPDGGASSRDRPRARAELLLARRGARRFPGRAVQHRHQGQAARSPDRSRRSRDARATATGCSIGSFSTARRRAAVKGLPGVATSISTIRALVRGHRRRKLGIVGLLRWMLREWMPCSCPRADVRHARSRRRAPSARFHGGRRRGARLDDQRSRDRCANCSTLGVDGLVTDRSDLALDLLAPLPRPSPDALVPITCESSENDPFTAFSRPPCRYT